MNTNTGELLVELPDAMWVAILDHLSLVDVQHVLGSTGRRLRTRWHQSLCALLQTIRIQSVPEALMFRHVFLPLSLTNLCQLDLGSYGTYEILLQVANDTLPRLQSISMVGSLGVTDNGLNALSGSQSFFETLQYIDITFCHNTSYAGTFCLRDNFPNLKVLRRQPEWMDGCFETPFENDGLHTYYADGSFQFERQQQSTGYVMHLDQWYNANPYFVFDKLQYSNFEMPGFWPGWARFFYRPGVSLLRLNDGEVLVGQTLRGLRPPRDYPRPEHVQLLPEAKSSVFLTRDGQVTATPQEQQPDDNSVENRPHYLISRMRVYPLPTLMPPDALVEKNRAFCQQLFDTWMTEDRTTEAAAEEALHRALNGD